MSRFSPLPRLLLLNGFPGAGKSTLARRYVADHPLALDLDVDRLRAQLGGWQDDPLAAGLAARELALAMARTHVTDGHDVVVPQFLGQRRFVDQLQQVAGEVGATFHHVVLLDGREDAVRRFHERTGRAEEVAHVEAARLVTVSGGEGCLHRMYDALLEVAENCGGVVRVPSRDGDVEGTYRAVLAALGRGAGE